MQQPVTRLFLIRHANSAPDKTLPEAQWPLSKLGEEQAIRLAKELSDRGIDLVFSSPYRRAVDTVRPLATRLGLEVRLVEDLRERRLGHGWQQDWEAILHKSWADFSFAAPGGESGFAARSRMRAALKQIATTHPGRTVAAASHGSAIALFLNSMDSTFGVDAWRAIQNPHVFVLSWDGTDWHRDKA